MLAYTVKRLILAVPVLLGLTVIVFLIMAMIPGDPASAILGSYATPENVERLNRQLGLDRGLVEQYFVWLGNLLQGDFGRSYNLNRPVIDEVLERFSATLILAGASLVLNHLVLPAVTLAVVATGVIARLTRAAMLEVLRQDYIRTARAKGVDETRVVCRHAFKAALVSVIPVIGVQAGFVLGGAVYIETVFQWPGIGRMLVTAISTRDLLLVQGGVLVVAASYVLFNLVTDLVQHWLDPRLRT